jgi:hypothetical protein
MFNTQEVANTLRATCVVTRPGTVVTSAGTSARTRSVPAFRRGVPAGHSGAPGGRCGFLKICSVLRLSKIRSLGKKTLVIVYSDLLHISEDSGMSVEDEVRCPTSGYSIDMSARQRPGDGRRGEQQHAHVGSKV